MQKVIPAEVCWGETYNEAFWGRYIHIHHYIYDVALKSISNADVTSIKNLILQRAMNVLFIPTKLNRMLSTWQNFFEIEKMLKSPDSSDHKEEMRPKFFPKVSFSHNKLNLCASQAKKLRWSEEVITSSLRTQYLFSKVFFSHCSSLEVPKGLNLQNSSLSQTYNLILWYFSIFKIKNIFYWCCK